MHPLPKGRAPWKWVLRLLLGVAAVWLLSRGASEAPLASLGQVSPLLLGSCIAAYWLGQALSARRWQILLLALAPSSSPSTCGQDRVRVSWRECLSWYAAGMFWNLWMPTGLGGDAARAVLAGRHVESGGAGALSVVLDRVLGLACLLAVATGALLVDAGLSGSSPAASGVHQARRVLLAAAVVGACAAAVAAVAWKRLPRQKWAREGGVKKKIAGLLDLVADGGAWKRPRVLGSIVLLSFGVQAIQIGINIALARAVGLELPPASVAWAAPVLALSSVVPLGIGGLGAREVGAVALLGASFGRGEILAWSLAWQGVVWLSSLGGAPWAWRWRRFNARSST
jgi:uncharacterized membrane protein YbhN (UPF0104 family)